MKCLVMHPVCDRFIPLEKKLLVHVGVYIFQDFELNLVKLSSSNPSFVATLSCKSARKIFLT